MAVFTFQKPQKVFLWSFVFCSKAFLNNFQAAQAAVFEASAAAAAVAKQNAKEAYTKATRMSLDIELKVCILLPSSVFMELMPIVGAVVYIFCEIPGTHCCCSGELTKF